MLRFSQHTPTSSDHWNLLSCCCHWNLSWPLRFAPSLQPNYYLSFWRVKFALPLQPLKSALSLQELKSALSVWPLKSFLSLLPLTSPFSLRPLKSALPQSDQPVPKCVLGDFIRPKTSALGRFSEFCAVTVSGPDASQIYRTVPCVRVSLIWVSSLVESTVYRHYIRRLNREWNIQIQDWQCCGLPSLRFALHITTAHVQDVFCDPDLKIETISSFYRQCEVVRFPL